MPPPGLQIPGGLPYDCALLHALWVPALLEESGQSYVAWEAGGGSCDHKDGPEQGALACRQGEEAWKLWKAGMYGEVSLSGAVVEYAKLHKELKRAFMTFQKEADQFYPGWTETLVPTEAEDFLAAARSKVRMEKARGSR